MSMNVTISKAPDIPENYYQYVSDILRDAFQERTKQGIHFQCGTFTPEDVKSYFTKDSEARYLFIAWDSDRPVGILMTMARSKGSFKFIRHDYLATIDEYKGKGVATVLFQHLLELSRKEKFDFIASVTNPEATSSVKYHVKRGFRICCKNFNGNSSEYSFIYPIRKFRFLNIFIFQKVIYATVTGIGYIVNKIRE